MNIYKKENQILVSLNGCPEGWTNLGFDATINLENSKYVIGFNKGKAVFDTDKMALDEVAEQDALVPQTLTPAQARLALLAINKLDAVETLMTQDSTPREAKILWEYATIFERKNPILIDLASSLNMDKAAIDQLFIQGAKL